ncbi:MAG: putative porin [Reichenbachiella sp.]
MSIPLRAQMVDDSTKMVYGPTSTRYITITDLKHSDTLYHSMDTSLHNLEYFEKHLGGDIDYQDLGVNGSALKPVYYQIPTTIGSTTGYTAYDPYVKKVEDFKYYDTKSPYILLDASFGGKGRNQVDFVFSRNINPQWNIGMGIIHTSTNKQLGVASLNENQVKSTGFDGFAYYRSKDRKYHAMFHMYKQEQVILETGGINKETLEDDLFIYEDADIYLINSQSWDTRTRLFFYHQYTIKPFFEVYNSVERTITKNEYTDYPLKESYDYYDQILIRTDSTLDAASFKETKVEAGIKGRLADHIYYSAYVKRRDLDYRYVYIEPFDHIGENYLGGDLTIHLANNRLGGQIEVLDAGNYYFKGYFQNSFLNASYTSSLYQPGLMTKRFFGNHYEWSNDFESTLANTINASIFYDFKFLYVEPEIEISTIDEYVYFDYDRLPNQESDPIFVNKYSLKANLLLFKNIHLENRVVWNNVSGDGANAMRVPEWSYYGKYYYENIVFNDFMEFQLGLDFRYKSAFYAKEYDPITQQFFLQDDLELPSYFTTDVFFVMKANNLSLYAKYVYAFQKRDEGYFVSPWYPGQRRAFDVGVRWMFFN